jgi:hypothetical protein
VAHHNIGDDCPGGHVFSLVDILETTVDRWIDAIKQHSLDGSAWKCVDDVRGIIAKYTKEKSLDQQ